MKAKVFVNLKPSILDPQGNAVAEALNTLGYKAVQDVRQGKYFELEMKEKNSENVKKKAEEICKKLLANPVIEDYKIITD